MYTGDVTGGSARFRTLSGEEGREDTAGVLEYLGTEEEAVAAPTATPLPASDPPLGPERVCATSGDTIRKAIKETHALKITLFMISPFCSQS
jgi:hypothetical protein